MKIPTNLKHQPVITLENYDKIDGPYANDSEAKGLSLGLAQWNQRGKVDISAKIWRNSGDRWSRQSEEMPLHRVIDLAIMIGKVYAYFQEAYRKDGWYDPENPVIGKVELQGALASLSVCTDNELIDEDIVLFRDALMGENGERLGERFRVLASILKEMGYC